MAREKFEFISERVIGTLPASFVKRWHQLNARKDRLSAAHEKLEKDFETFEAKLGTYVTPEHETPAQDGFRFDEDGKLFQTFCKCVECQAVLHEMSPTQTVEAMIRSKALPPDQLEAARKHAYEIEAECQRNDDERMLFN